MKSIIFGLFALSCLMIGSSSADDVLPGSWHVNDSGIICIKFNAEVTFDITYMNKTHKEIVRTVSLVNNEHPLNTTSADGLCAKTKADANEELAIEFFEDWALTLKFSVANDMWMLSDISLDFALESGRYPIPDFGGNVTDVAELDSVNKFETKVNKSYQCESKLTFENMTEGPVGALLSITMNFHNMQLEAFKKSTSNTFSAPTTCPEDAVSNIVPIAVGAALAALVLIVLIAYLIGRQKSRRGYESV